MSRRRFLHTSGAAASALLASQPRTVEAATKQIEPRADSMILLWMAGGMAQTETFDPKRFTPYAPGLESKAVLSTFPSIDTAVDNIKLSKGLEQIGSVMDRGTLIRSHQVGDLGFILHSRHQYQWHTGYAPPLTVAAPHMGAVMAKVLGPRNPNVPPFIDIGQDMEIGGESDSLKAFHTAGFLGAEYGPFMIEDPSHAVRSVQPPAALGRERFVRRYRALQKLIESNPTLAQASRYQQESWLRSLENAQRLLDSPSAAAFDLSREPKSSYDTYNTGRFGLGCLLARRLVEEGARFIEVTTGYIPFRFWDTHDHGHERAQKLKAGIDAPVAQLIRDLEERGLLDRTLVVLATEFGRDMIVEGKPTLGVKHQVEQPERISDPAHYGMHRHFTEAVSVAVFGGGFRKGFLYGRTADERPCSVVENPISIEDLHASLYLAMGISPDHAHEVEKRPFYVTRDGLGRPVMDLFG